MILFSSAVRVLESKSMTDESELRLGRRCDGLRGGESSKRLGRVVGFGAGAFDPGGGGLRALSCSSWERVGRCFSAARPDAVLSLSRRGGTGRSVGRFCSRVESTGCLTENAGESSSVRDPYNQKANSQQSAHGLLDSLQKPSPLVPRGHGRAIKATGKTHEDVLSSEGLSFDGGSHIGGPWSERLVQERIPRQRALGRHRVVEGGCRRRGKGSVEVTRRGSAKVAEGIVGGQAVGIVINAVAIEGQAGRLARGLLPYRSHQLESTDKCRPDRRVMGKHETRRHPVSST